MSMRKAFIWFTAVIITVGLFGVTEVMAFNDFCDDPETSLTKGGWTIELIDIKKCSDSDFCTVPGGFDWHYRVYWLDNKDRMRASGLNFIAWLCPDCCTDPKIAFDLNQSEPGNMKYFPEGVGEPALWFGKFNKQARVLKSTKAVTDYHLITNTNVMTASTILLKTARHKGKKCKPKVLAFEMAVPGCSPNLSDTGAFTSLGNYSVEVAAGVVSISVPWTDNCEVDPDALVSFCLKSDDDCVALDPINVSVPEEGVEEVLRRAVDQPHRFAAADPHGS